MGNSLLDRDIWSVGGCDGSVALFEESRLPWLHHLLLLPCMWRLLAGGKSLMLSAITDPDFDAMFGGPVLPAVLAFFLEAGGYIAAVIVRQFQVRAIQEHIT